VKWKKKIHNKIKYISTYVDTCIYVSTYVYTCIYVYTYFIYLFIYCPNFIPVIERSGFPPSSVSTLGTSLKFLIWMLYLLMVNMLGCEAISGTPLYRTPTQTFLVGVGQLVLVCGFSQLVL
jgi:hypothetical protein